MDSITARNSRGSKQESASLVDRGNARKRCGDRHSHPTRIVNPPVPMSRSSSAKKEQCTNIVKAGELRMIKIVPKQGLPYYLVPRDDTRGFGDLEQADMLIPSWKIIEF